jgi:hypothetical protein
VVTSFFAALDSGSSVDAMALVCAEQQQALGPPVSQMAAYSWSVPLVESNDLDGQDRVLVVSVSASDPDGTVDDRLRILVTGAGPEAKVCGLTEV